MGTIYLVSGEPVLVDDDDYDRLSRYRWYFTGGYATRYYKRRFIMMHRDILPAPPGKEVDHINGNRLDNRRCNLRLATRTQNCFNRGPARNSATGYKGVSVRREDGLYVAYFKMERHRSYLGSYKTAEEAAKAYDCAARYYAGEFAKTNFPGEEAATADVLRERAKAALKPALDQRTLRGGVSHFRGVCYSKDKRRKRWRAEVSIDGRRHYIGHFLAEEEAARAYDAYVLHKYGRCVLLNFPEETETRNVA
jgi:hypothetical protein